MKTTKINFEKISLLLGDILLLYLSLYLSLVIRYQHFLSAQTWQLHWPIFSALFVIWLVILYGFNFYELFSLKNNLEFIRNYLPTVILNLFLGIIYFYLLSFKTNLTPKTILLIQLFIFSLLFFAWRKSFFGLMRFEKLRQNLLFIGYQPLISAMYLHPESFSKNGFNAKGLVTFGDVPNLPEGLKLINPENVEETIKKEKINLLVINEPQNQKIIDLLFKILPLHVNFISLTGFYEQIHKKIPLDLINRGWFLENFSEGSKAFFEMGKRIFDLVLGVILVVICLILSPFIMFGIAVSSKGPVIFSQKRVGKEGKIFTALKFRTMYVNAEKSGPMWAKENDPRITPFGSFLRKTRLDEIPQLFNIIKGDMSFVGPRPERPEFIAELIKAIPFYRERLLVKPGLTGWAQINLPYADSVESSLKKLQYDLYYIKNRSIFFDLSIVLKTANILVKKLGR